jgi:hypothetical protein
MRTDSTAPAVPPRLACFAWLAWCVWLAMQCVAAPARAQPNSQARLEALARLPDWSGVWEVEGSTATLEPANAADAEPRDHAPFTAEWEARYAQVRDALPSQSDSRLRYCAAGMPRLMASSARFIALVTPEQTLLQFATREIRHIWTDGRAHPSAEELRPTAWGDSIGHWEAETLVIDTVAVKADRWLDPTGATLSGQARIFERLSMPERNHLQDEITIVDPVALRAPWRFTRSYRRAPTKELGEQQCGWTPVSVAAP